MTCANNEHQWVAPVRFVLAAVGSDSVRRQPVSVWAAPTNRMQLDPHDALPAKEQSRRQEHISNEPNNAEVFCARCQMDMFMFFRDPQNAERLGLNLPSRFVEGAARAYWRDHEGQA